MFETPFFGHLNAAGRKGSHLGRAPVATCRAKLCVLVTQVSVSVAVGLGAGEHYQIRRAAAVNKYAFSAIASFIEETPDMWLCLSGFRFL